jgi:cellulose synthase/poly-beta-1,6-N-acetylglucosamine synthase-like glycosyltransferase
MDRGVELVRSPDRVGKTAAQNLAVAEATGEVLVFSDASTVLENGSLRAIVAPLADPQVGLVSSEDVPGISFQHAAAEGEGLYVRYEMWLRRLETATGCLVGASGCFYAARRSLRGELGGGLVEDFALPLQVLASGHRVVAEPAARAFVPATASVSAEFRRRVRIQIGGVVALWHYRRLLNPIRFPHVSWRLLSHKIARWLMPGWLVLLLATSAVLAPVNVFCALLCASQIACCALGLTGWLLSGRNRLPAWVSVPFSFLLANAAITVGLAQAMLGRRAEIWQPSNRSVPERGL